MAPEGLTPSQAAVLLAVHRGIDTVEGLAKALRVSREVVERIVEELKAAGLLEEYRSGLILKRRRLRLTRQGLDAVPEAMRLMEHAAVAAKKLLQEQRLPEDWSWGPRELLLAAPLLPMLGLLTAMEAMMLLSVLTGLALADDLAWTVGWDGEPGEDAVDAGDGGDLDGGELDSGLDDVSLDLGDADMEFDGGFDGL
ncbi:helix-turn-helix domain-containing protein [Pyrodictium abyssi]|uniref:HTH marR-type domain-containing protein n=1 Tax=Pyrodictium abyssi TaxID=54256 RepID=A0ABN6ZVU0_9CREN|nr:hypothetical protein PABY_23890 [Pyrodictium abyssi]